jgi:ABC-type glycerol-3-phosphate transport system permease component
MLIIFPLYFMATTAFKFESEIYSELTWFPREPTLTNFVEVIYSFRIPVYLRNTLIVALTTTSIVVVISVLAAYALTRLRFPGRAVMARGVLFVYLVPGSLMLIPMYLIISSLQLKDTYFGLIIANMSFAVPFCTWLLMGYLRNISVEMEEAALIDGCTRLQSLWHIVIPLSIPGIVTAAIFIFNNVWNEFIFALILAQDESHRMISVGLSNFYRSDYYMVGPMMAGSLIAMAPVVILYIIAQRYVVSGLAAGAVKG